VARVDLGGVHANTAQQLNLDSLGLTVDATYSLDICYAHRSKAHGPALQVQTSEAVLCTVVTSGLHLNQLSVRIQRR